MSTTTESTEVEEPKQEPIPTLAKAPREIRVVHDDSSLAYINDTARFEHSYRVAESMAIAGLLPEHLLRDKKRGEFTFNQIKGNCFRIVMQAMRWGVDPFALLDDTFVTGGGKIGYQGKVILAIINTRAGLKERLAFSFSGTEGKDDFTITLTGTFRGEETPRTATLSVGRAKTEQAMWRTDPEQKLIYSGAIRWARRHCPEIIFGVTTEDDEDRREYWASQAARSSKAPKPAFEKAAEAVEVTS